MQKILMWIMALGALAGGLDRLLGNRMGLGRKFEDGFQYLGPTALSMAGIICLAPLLSNVIGPLVSPACAALGLDPGLLGGLLAIDMGGFQMARDLCFDPAVGRFAGIIVAATFGCTISFTIPVGVGMIEPDDQPRFARGILLGLAAMLTALLAGGLCCGLTLAGHVSAESAHMPGFALFLLGLWRIPAHMIRGFTVFAALIRALTTLGLMLGAFQYMTGCVLLPRLASLEEAMAVVSSIGIVLLGSLPVAELRFKCALRRPFMWFGHRIGVNDISVAGLLISMVSIIPVLTILRDMDQRGKVINVAAMICTTSMLAAHLGFTASAAPDTIPALFLAKLCGGAAAILLALLFTRRENERT